MCVCECMFQCCRDDKGSFKFVDESIAHELVYAHMAMFMFVMLCNKRVIPYSIKSGYDCIGCIDN